jgi:hypothetical protein
VEQYEEWYAKNRRDSDRNKAPIHGFLALLGED